MSKLQQRGIGDLPEKTITKPASEIKIGDNVKIDDLDFTVYQIDKTKNGYCFVDRYACDYNVTKNQKIEIITKKEKVVTSNELSNR